MASRACLSELRADGSFFARFPNRNATCPVCGALVYYFQNELGSRVYFDEVGPPWPKHPCTDGFQPSDYATEESAAATISVRSASETARIDGAYDALGVYPELEFSQKYGSGPWDAWIVDICMRGRGRRVLILSPMGRTASRRIIKLKYKCPRSLRNGSMVYRYSKWLSYFDTATLEVVELEVEPINSLAGFIEEVVAIRGGSRS